MILHFLLKGLLRDRSRSTFPMLIVIVGVALTVVLHTWMNGAFGSMVQDSAHFQTGHIKVMTRAYKLEADQLPNDLAMLDLTALKARLAADYSEIEWAPRILFGGLLDIPDEQGETRVQGPVFGMGIDLLNPESKESERLNLAGSLVRGQLPTKANEILISEDLAQQMAIEPGARATLLGVTMYGSMATANFTVVGTIRFGVSAMDRGALVVDLADIQRVMDMEDAAGELLGFFIDDNFSMDRAARFCESLNKTASQDDEFAPVMISLADQNGLGDMLRMANGAGFVMVTVFMGMMFIVLWNAGLMSALRRYGEIGIRLAIGEPRGQIYRAMLLESLMLGLAGSALGTLMGLSVAWYLQVHGVDMGDIMKDSTMIMSTVMRARITPATYVIGFVPGILATLLGTATAGIGIYKRQTSQLFKELEV